MSFFFNDTATTEIYTLSLHDALPIFSSFLTADCLLPSPSCRLPGTREAGGADWRSAPTRLFPRDVAGVVDHQLEGLDDLHQDRKSTRLNSSHANISYAVFCLKKKKST